MKTTTLAPERPGGTRRQLWRALAAIVVVLGMFAAPGWWWWRHPDVFYEVHEPIDWSGSTIDLAYGPYRYEVAESLEDASGTARIDKAEPVVVTNTADATVTLSVCTTKPRAHLSFSGPMWSMEGYCSEVVPLEKGFVLPLGKDPGYQVTVTIAPEHEGLVQVAGVRLTYKHGIRYGTQLVAYTQSIQFVGAPVSDG
jgi:hypothetical protein